MHQPARMQKKEPSSSSYLRGSARPIAPPRHDSMDAASKVPTFDLRNIPIFPSTESAQVRMSEPGDGEERRAEGIAEQVLRMPVPTRAALPLQPAREEPGVSPLPHRATTLPAETSDLLSGVASPTTHEKDIGLGQPLDQATQAFMEPRFGFNLSQVCIHTEERAATAANAVSASAYTIGRHIVFGREQYAPTTRSGQRFLAHELAHIVSPSPRVAIQRMKQSTGGKEEKQQKKKRSQKKPDVQVMETQLAKAEEELRTIQTQLQQMSIIRQRAAEQQKAATETLQKEKQKKISQKEFNPLNDPFLLKMNQT